MAAVVFWFRSALGRFGSRLGPVRTGPVRIVFGLGLFFIGRVNGLVGWLKVGPMEALKEKCWEGIIFKESLMIGDKENDEVVWELCGNDWSINGLSGLFKVSKGWWVNAG
ncbi:hypothetical protein P8452_23982 [Trifolium repens]|nr:hypothetical protein P8452_23982 [Trifolium repens]